MREPGTCAGQRGWPHCRRRGKVGDATLTRKGGSNDGRRETCQSSSPQHMAMKARVKVVSELSPLVTSTALFSSDLQFVSYSQLLRAT